MSLKSVDYNKIIDDQLQQISTYSTERAIKDISEMRVEGINKRAHSEMIDVQQNRDRQLLSEAITLANVKELNPEGLSDDFRKLLTTSQDKDTLEVHFTKEQREHLQKYVEEKYNDGLEFVAKRAEVRFANEIVNSPEAKEQCESSIKFLEKHCLSNLVEDELSSMNVANMVGTRATVNATEKLMKMSKELDKAPEVSIEETMKMHKDMVSQGIQP